VEGYKVLNVLLSGVTQDYEYRGMQIYMKVLDSLSGKLWLKTGTRHHQQGTETAIGLLIRSQLWRAAFRLLLASKCMKSTVNHKRGRWNRLLLTNH
jgi:hypothetical protein